MLSVVDAVSVVVVSAFNVLCMRVLWCFFMENTQRTLDISKKATVPEG